MGRDGWNELQDDVTLVGIAQGDNYSGHEINPLKPLLAVEDWDWSLFVQPAPGFENLATNRGGVRNKASIIECEIQPPDGFWDDRTMHHYLDPLIGHTVTVVGTWVEDKSHNNKTEIHPITSILDEHGNEGGLLTNTEKLIRLLVFCDTSTPQRVWRPHLPPHANELRVGRFRVQFPSSLEQGHVPLRNIREEVNHSLSRNFVITVQGNDAFLEGAVQVDRNHAFYFGRIYMGYRSPQAQHVFGRNAAGELIHYYWAPQPGWAAENLTRYGAIGAAYQFASDPVVINLQSGDTPTQHVFGRNAAGELIHYYWAPQPGWAAENLTRYGVIGAAYQFASNPKVINL